MTAFLVILLTAQLSTRGRESKVALFYLLLQGAWVDSFSNSLVLTYYARVQGKTLRLQFIFFLMLLPRDVL